MLWGTGPIWMGPVLPEHIHLPIFCKPKLLSSCFVFPMLQSIITLGNFNDIAGSLMSQLKGYRCWSFGALRVLNSSSCKELTQFAHQRICHAQLHVGLSKGCQKINDPRDLASQKIIWTLKRFFPKIIWPKVNDPWKLMAPYILTPQICSRLKFNDSKAHLAVF